MKLFVCTLLARTQRPVTVVKETSIVSLAIYSVVVYHAAESVNILRVPGLSDDKECSQKYVLRSCQLSCTTVQSFGVLSWTNSSPLAPSGWSPTRATACALLPHPRPWAPHVDLSCFQDQELVAVVLSAGD